MFYKKGELTPKQKRFCEEYLIDHNQVQASIRAGYSKRSANIHATRVFWLPQVQAYIKPLMEKITQKTLLTAELVLEEMARIAFANIADYYKQDPKTKKWKIKDLNELTPKQQACISEYSPGEFIKLHSKDSALDKLGKHFKLYTDIDAVVNNLVVMPTLQISGKEVVFEVGRPAPQITAQKTN